MKKIVLTGPECVGKTNLTLQLAAHFHTLYCIEYTRAYLTIRNQAPTRKATKVVSDYADVEPMAIGQLAMEDSIIEQSQFIEYPIVFFDTNVETNLIYSQYYFQQTPTWLNEIAAKRSYDFYLLLYPDIAWVADELRDRPNARMEMYELFKNYLQTNQRNFMEIKGTDKQRLKNAIEAIEVSGYWRE
jgi:nicotinamide riboside kinase